MKLLRATDATAYYAELNKPTFLTIGIPTKAKELAKSLIGLLADTFYEWIPIRNIDRILSQMFQEEGAVEGLMNRALELKAKMLLCEEFYYLVHVRRGAAFDAKTMSTEMADRNTSSKLVEVPPRVKLCLCPGLSVQGSRQHSHKGNTGKLLDWRQTLVRHSLSKQEEPGVESGSVETVCNAVVLLESEN